MSISTFLLCSLKLLIFCSLRAVPARIHTAADTIVQWRRSRVLTHSPYNSPDRILAPLSLTVRFYGIFKKAVLQRERQRHFPARGLDTADRDIHMQDSGHLSLQRHAAIVVCTRAKDILAMKHPRIPGLYRSGRALSLIFLLSREPVEDGLRDENHLRWMDSPCEHLRP